MQLLSKECYSRVHIIHEAEWYMIKLWYSSNVLSGTFNCFLVVSSCTTHFASGLVSSYTNVIIISAIIL